MSLVAYEVRDGVADLRLRRPEKRNAINLDLAADLSTALARFAADGTARAAVLHGEGPSFCAGGDISMFPALDGESGLRFVRDVGEPISKALQRLRKPVIAAVHRYCIAGGLELALACHFVYASADAVFGMEEINLGLIPGWGGTVRLSRIRERLALEMLLTGRRLSAEEALSVGLINRVLGDAEQCLTEAHAIAASIAGKSPLAVEAAMDIVRVAQDDIESAFSLEQAMTALLFGSAGACDAIDEALGRGIGK